MKIIELTIDDNIDTTNLRAISFVDQPAIEIDFISLSKNNEIIPKYSFEKVKAGEKKMVYGPALIPNKLILRKDEQGNPFEVYFSQETVEKCARMYMMNTINNFTIDHQDNIRNLYIVENWIVDDPGNDKSNFYGFSVPKGSWMIGVRVDNDMVWEKIKNGEVKGFSIEGFFIESFVKHCFKKEISEEEYIKQTLESIYNDKNITIEKATKIFEELYKNFKK